MSNVENLSLVLAKASLELVICGHTALDIQAHDDLEEVELTRASLSALDVNNARNIVTLNRGQRSKSSAHHSHTKKPLLMTP
jgi:hypothetical protein